MTELVPAALEGPITVGELSPPADPRPVDFDRSGYLQEEFFASGTAAAYTVEGPLSEDGRWAATPTTTAPYRTRFLVRRPRDAKRFNGTVVVEWLNVSAAEAAPEWAYSERAIVDTGTAWIGVSVQSLGVVGGTSLMQTGDAEQADRNSGLAAADPARYATLHHPGDAYAFDIFSQIGAAIRSPGDVPVLGGGVARHVVAAGESQSAAFLTTYVNAIQPLVGLFDGFFVHSRGYGAARLDGSAGMNDSEKAYRFRTDGTALILAMETETDVGPVLSYARARQTDTDCLRVWEVAGTAHADAFLVGDDFALSSHPINRGPQHYVVNAALDALMRWVWDGTKPPHGDRIETDGDHSTTILRDRHGNARGGVRTPSLDVPVATLSGEVPRDDGPSPDRSVASPGVDELSDLDRMVSLFGSTTPFSPETLGSLYPDRSAYLEAFDEALDRAIGLGFVRAGDRDLYAAESRAFPI